MPSVSSHFWLAVWVPRHQTGEWESQQPRQGHREASGAGAPSLQSHFARFPLLASQDAASCLPGGPRSPLPCGEGSPQSTSKASSEAGRSAAWLTGSLTRHQEARLILSPPWGGRQTSSDRPLKCKVCPCLSSPQALRHFTNHAGSSP